MKKTLLIVALLLSTSFVSASPQTEIQVKDIMHQPAEPGDTVKVDVMVRNSGDNEGEYQALEIETTEHIEYMGTTSNFAEGFSLNEGDQTVGTIYLKINSDATAGSHPVDIIVKNTDDIGVVEKTVIEVDSAPNIVNSGRAEVKQGESSEFELGLENIGKDTATQITASLEHPQMTFNPSTAIFSDLSPEEFEEQSITVEASEKLSSGPTTAQATIEYVNNNERKIQNRSIPVQVLKDVELAVSKIDTSDAVRNSESRIMIEIENIGNSRAESITSRIACDGAVENEDQDFVGSLDADESVPTAYKVTPEQESIECSLAINYSASEENSLQESFTFTAERESKLVIPAATLLLIAAGLIYYKRRRN